MDRMVREGAAEGRADMVSPFSSVFFRFRSFSVHTLTIPLNSFSFSKEQGARRTDGRIEGQEMAKEVVT